MPVGEIDNRTPEEIMADLEARRKDHKFLTSEEARSWNARQVKTPLSKNHWSVKEAKIKHVLRMGGAWKRLAKMMYMDINTVAARVKEMNACIFLLKKENTELKRRMVYCGRCEADPGDECKFTCTRDGSRDQ